MIATTPSNPLIEVRGKGRTAGLKHGELSPDAQRDTIARCIAGISSAGAERTYWLGYAETAWQIARDIAFAPIDTLYGELPLVEGDVPRTFRSFSSYQGQTDYHPSKPAHVGERLSFRWARCPWRWSWLTPDQRYWNFDTQEEFERSINDAHGLLVLGGEPVDAETLSLFRDQVCPVARTGFFCHIDNRWKQCGPTTEKPSIESYRKKQGQVA